MNIDRRIATKMERACEVRARAESISATFSQVKVKGGKKTGSKLERAVEELDKWENEILDDIHALVLTKMEVERTIEKLVKPQEREVLELHYLQGLRWEEVCVKMHYSWRYTMKIHARALRNLQQLL